MSIGGNVAQSELDIENKLVELSCLLDAEYGVTEWYDVLTDAVNKHIELIEEDGAQ